MFKVLAALLITIVSVNTAQARWGFGIGQSNINEDQSVLEGIEDSSTALSFFYTQPKKNKTNFTIGTNLYMYDDNQGFTNNTTGGVKSSSASGVSIFGDIGYRFKTNSKLTFIPKAGYEAMISSTRSIPNCTNCDEEDIDIDAGIYAEIATKFHLKKSDLQIRFRQFIDGDEGLENAIFFDWAAR